MTARRVLAGLGLLLAACTTAACAQVVSGTGSAAPDIQGQVTASPSGSPTSPGGLPVLVRPQPLRRVLLRQRG